VRVYLVVLAAVVAMGGGCSTSDPAPAKAPKHKVAKTTQQIVEEGKDLLTKGQKAEAIRAFSRAIKADPKCKEAFSWRAAAFSETGKANEAVADYTKAIALDPNDAYLYDQRSILYRTVLRDKTKAEADKDKAEKLREKQRDQIRANVEKVRNKSTKQ
jgi:Flp pilus assembly protein TadD